MNSKGSDSNSSVAPGKGGRVQGSSKNMSKTASPKTQVTQTSAGKNSPGNILDLQKFFKETMLELKKITWPDRQQILRETASVIFLVLLITLTVLAFDWAVAKVVFEPLDHLARNFGGGVGIHH